jgi:hypothetical protein
MLEMVYRATMILDLLIPCCWCFYKCVMAAFYLILILLLLSLQIYIQKITNSIVSVKKIKVKNY